MTQDEALKKLLAGGNYFLTGAAGSGKSYLLNQFIEKLKKRGKNVLVCAPTGIAALNIGGRTLHSEFFIPLNCYDLSEETFKSYDAQRTIEKISYADTIIIDEISMCRVDVFEYVCLIIQAAIKEKGKPIQVVLCGDIMQLPPVVGKDGDYLDAFGFDRSGFFFTSMFYGIFDFKPLKLTEQHRQNDPVFYENLEKLRNGNLSCIPYFNQRSLSNDGLEIDDDDDLVNIRSTKAEIDKINSEKLDEIDEPLFISKAVVEGDFKVKDCTAPEVLMIKPGARVMTLINSKGFQNGSIGTVIKIGKKYIYVNIWNDKKKTYSVEKVEKFTWTRKKTIVVYKDMETGIIYRSKIENRKLIPKLIREDVGSFEQFPLRLAYAVTTHKSQGQTYPGCIVNPTTFDYGQLYVAISRAKDINQLFLTREILPGDVKTSYKAIKFSNDFLCQASEEQIKKRQNILRKTGQDFQTTMSKIEKIEDVKKEKALKKEEEKRKKELEREEARRLKQEAAEAKKLERKKKKDIEVKSPASKRGKYSAIKAWREANSGELKTLSLDQLQTRCAEETQTTIATVRKHWKIIDSEENNQKV